MRVQRSPVPPFAPLERRDALSVAFWHPAIMLHSCTRRATSLAF